VGKKGIGATAPNFFNFDPPTFEFAHPEFSVLGGQKRIFCPPNLLNVKQELLNYHNTVHFLHNIQGGQF